AAANSKDIQIMLSPPNRVPGQHTLRLGATVLDAEQSAPRDVRLRQTEGGSAVTRRYRSARHPIQPDWRAAAQELGTLDSHGVFVKADREGQRENLECVGPDGEQRLAGPDLMEPTDAQAATGQFDVSKAAVRRSIDADVPPKVIL